MTSGVAMGGQGEGSGNPRMTVPSCSKHRPWEEGISASLRASRPYLLGHQCSSLWYRKNKQKNQGALGHGGIS